MPAKSKSQQRLFAMVHAYNKGEFHGSRSLRSRVASLASHISDEDARHFAKTPRKGLPERVGNKETKEAQVVLRPEDVQAMYGRVQPGLYAAAEEAARRSRRRRSFLGKVVTGTLLGTAIGGVGAGLAGAALANHVASGSDMAPGEIRDRLLDAGIRCGLWGAEKGAIVGSLTGIGAGVLDKIRE